MPSVKVNMRGVDPEESLKSDFMPPPPGLHKCKIKECEPAKSKRSGNPMLKVVFQPVEGNYGQVWYYPTFSDEDFPKRKMDQFLQAVGVLTKSKREASFNTDTIIGKTVMVNMRAKRQDENTPLEQKGTYQADVSDVWAVGEDDTDEFDATGGDPVEEFEADEFEGDEEDTEEPVEGLFSKAEIEAMESDQLKEILGEYEVKIPPRVRAPKLRELVLKAQAEFCEAESIDDPAGEPADEEDADDDDEMMDEGETEVSEDAMLTEAGLMAMSAAELKGVAKDFDLTVSGKKRSQVVSEILEAQGADEEPF